MTALPPLAAEGRGRAIVRVALLALGQAVCGGVAAFATRDVFAALATRSEAPLAALTALALSGLAIAALRVAERVLAERLGHEYAGAVRLQLFRHVSRLPQRAVAERRAGALALRFVGDLQAVRGWIAMGLTRLISAAIVVPLTIAVLFLLDPVLGAAAALPLAAGFVLMALAGRTLASAHGKLRSRRARLAADLSERLPHGPELRLLGRLEIECGRLRRRTADLIDAAVVRARRSATLRTMPDVATAAAAAALLAAAWITAAAPADAAGSLAALGLLTQPLRAMADAWDRRRAWLLARDKCAEVLRTAPVRRPRERGLEAEAEAGRLAFHAVRCGTGAAFDAVARPGEKIAVVGPNGGGKSMLLALAAGLERPAVGRVTLGRAETCALARRERCAQIAFAGPRSPILKGTLRRALCMGCAEVPEDRAIRACAGEVGLAPLIDRLGGLDGTVAEGGRNLSAGERRRVLVARALLAGADLLLLDEPDDALDPTGAEVLVRLLRGQPATTLVITHDLALVRRMDTLWFVDGNRVVASGSAAQLLAHGPVAAFFRPCSAA